METSTTNIFIGGLALVLTAVIAVGGWLVRRRSNGVALAGAQAAPNASGVLAMRDRLTKIETDVQNFRGAVDRRCEERGEWLKETSEAVRRLDRNIIRLAATLAPGLELEAG